jgi:hypothetical protein
MTVAAQSAVMTTARSKEELLSTISASRLGTWQSCRLKFFFKYVQGLIKPPSPAMRVGSICHAVLQEWSLARWRGRSFGPDELSGVFEGAWMLAQVDEPIDWADNEEATKASALQLLRTYIQTTPIPASEIPEAVEVSAEMELGGGLPQLVGILDLVRKGGKIVDFKTTSRTPDPAMVRHMTEVQTTAYSLLFRASTDRNESGVELHHLVRLKSPKVMVTEVGPATDQQITRFLHLVESYARGVEREDYVPAPSVACCGCPWFNECRAWR